MLSPEDIAHEMKVSAKTVRRWIANGDLPAMDCGSVYRIDPERFEAWKAERMTKGGAR